jgi:hypothetical protein
MIILLFLVVQTSAGKPLANRMEQTQEFTDTLVEKLVDRLSDQSLKLWPLDNTVLGKPGNLAMSPSTKGIRYTTAFRANPLLQSDCERPSFHGNPTLHRTQIPMASALRQSSHMRCSIMARAQVGDKIPDVNLHKGFPPTMMSLREETKGKKVVLVGLPAAFTPT